MEQTIFYRNGDRYEGEVKDNAANGQGIDYYAKGIYVFKVAYGDRTQELKVVKE